MTQPQINADRDRITARVIEQERIIRLSAHDAAAFLAAVDKPASPNKKLRQALNQHEKRCDNHAGIFNWAPQQK